MSDALTTVLIFMPLLVAVVVTVVLHRKIRRPVLFAIVSALGLQAIVAPAAVTIFLSSANSAGNISSGTSFNQAIFASAAIIILVGVPLLLWLSRAFRVRNE